MEREIKHIPSTNRFEINEDGETAYIRYRPFEGGLDLVSTYVPHAIEGRGIAATLTRHVFEYARENGLKVKPTCPYIDLYAKRHPEYSEIIC